MRARTAALSTGRRLVLAASEAGGKAAWRAWKGAAWRARVLALVALAAVAIVMQSARVGSTHRLVAPQRAARRLGSKTDLGMATVARPHLAPAPGADDAGGGVWKLYIGDANSPDAYADEREEEEDSAVAPPPKPTLRHNSSKVSKPWNAFQNATYADARCAITDDVVNHSLKRIRSTALFHQPYPHVYVTDVFPASFYKCIMSRLVTRHRTEAHYVKLKPNQERYTINLARRPGARVGDMVYGPHVPPGESRKPGLDVAFWTEFGKRFSSQPFVEAWLDKFQDVVKKRFEQEKASRAAAREAWASQHPNETYTVPRQELRLPDQKLARNTSEFYYELSLNRDLQGYGIKPHTDSANKWVTTLFFMPSRGRPELEKLGTSVIMSKSGKVDDGGGIVNWAQPEHKKDMQVSKTARFIPNTLFAFPPCLSSWHAVVRFNANICRDTIQGFVMNDLRLEKRVCGR